MRSSWLPLALLAAVLALPLPAAALAVGQVDDFEDGTTQGWVVAAGPGGGGHPAPPVNVPTGGPEGADDGWLLLTAVGGTGPGSRLVAINASQWAGSYTAAGIVALHLAVNNLGSSDLALRILFEDPQGAPPANQAISTVPVLVPAGGGWTSVLFPIRAADLTALEGSADDALAGATLIRIVHGSGADYPGEAIVAQLGVDDVRAVPEPGAAALLACGVGALAAVRRRAR